MSKLDELITQLCPDGIQYKRLVEVANILYGYPCNASLFNSDKNGMPLVRIRDVLKGYTDTFTTEIVPDDYYINDGDFLVGMDGNFNSGNWNGGEAILCQRTCKIQSDPTKNEVLNGFLSHLLGPIFKKIEFSKQSGTVKHLLAKDINNIVIPIPPLEIQEKIVCILDSFTELEAGLEAELEARKKQYEYYRDDLLKPNDNTQLAKLGDFATIIRGGNFQKKHFTESGFPCIHYGQMYTHFGTFADKTLTYIPNEVAARSKIASKNDIVMAVTSENIEDVCKCTAWIGDDDIAVSGHTAIIKHDQNPKYLSYYFHSSHFYKDKVKLAHGTKVIEVTPSTLNDVKIPLPSIEDQNKIVEVLDKFDFLCNSISTGLPAEIKARHQQYEYYRDKLLTFKEKATK